MAKIQLFFAGELLREYSLDDRRELRVGRASDCDIVIDSVPISRHHCTFREVERHWHLIDEGSSNGSFVNGERVQECVLKHKDRVVIGKHTLMFDQLGSGRDPRLKQLAVAEPGEERTMFVSPGALSKMLERSQPQQPMGLVLSKPYRHVLRLTQEVTVIGRGQHADLVIHGLFVRDEQAKVIKSSFGYNIVNTGGLRAMRVNGERHEAVSLWAGDIITIAGNRITYGSL